MEERQFICINCPIGCLLSTKLENGKVVSISGNTCKKGADYAQQEAIAPYRVLTCLMRASNRQKPFSVKTNRPIPKGLLFRCANQIYHTRPSPPILMGETIIKNICNTGADVVATQTIF